MRITIGIEKIYFYIGYPLWHTLAYYHIITMINMNCALWYINSRAIKAASYSLAECFLKVSVQY